MFGLQVRANIVKNRVETQSACPRLPRETYRERTSLNLERLIKRSLDDPSGYYIKNNCPIASATLAEHDRIQRVVGQISRLNASECTDRLYRISLIIQT